ncbi:MAG: hypothetical protein ACOYIA_05020 [Eubacteriales bacterium]
MKKSVAFAVFLLCLLVVLSGCSEYSLSGGDFYAGETITPDKLAAISESIAAAASTSTEKETKPPDTDTEGNIIVYWTKSGGVWHYDRSCSSLARSAAVESGTIEEAEKAGKSRTCLKCGPPGGDTGDTDTAGESEPGES